MGASPIVLALCCSAPCGHTRLCSHASGTGSRASRCAAGAYLAACSEASTLAPPGTVQGRVGPACSYPPPSLKMFGNCSLVVVCFRGCLLDACIIQTVVFRNQLRVVPEHVCRDSLECAIEPLKLSMGFWVIWVTSCMLYVVLCNSPQTHPR